MNTNKQNTHKQPTITMMRRKTPPTASRRHRPTPPSTCLMCDDSPGLVDNHKSTRNLLAERFLCLCWGATAALLY
jgi:hypothetical protein